MRARRTVHVMALLIVACASVALPRFSVAMAAHAGTLASNRRLASPDFGLRTRGFGRAQVIPSTQAKGTSVTGTINYQLPDGTSNPVRRAKVVLIDDRPGATGCAFKLGGACGLEATQTGAGGQYHFTAVPPSTTGPRMLRVRVYADGMVDTAHTWQVGPAGSGGSYYFAANKALPATGATVENITAPATTTAGQAFSLFDIARLALEWATAKDVPLSAHIAFPAASTDVNGSTISVASSDAFATDRVLGQLGRVLEIENGIGGPQLHLQHAFGQDITKSVGKASGIAGAWQMGLADFFAVRARNDLPASALPRGRGLSGTDYVQGAGLPNVPLASNARVAAVGEGDELAVARVLWAVSAGKLPAVKLTLDQMVRQFRGVTSLSGAVSVLRSLTHLGFAGSPASAQTAGALGCTLADNAVAPRVASPASLLLDANTPPTFTWPRGGTPTFPLDHFDVYVFDNASYSLIASQKDVPADAGATSGAFTWTPDVNGDPWQKLVSATTKNASHPTLLLDVEGAGKDQAPATGPYPSCGAVIGRFRPTLRARGANTNLFPPEPSCSFDPSFSQFVVTAASLIPFRTYDLILIGTAGGVTLNKKVGSITADKNGRVRLARFTLPQVPGHDAWGLVAKPHGSGEVARGRLATFYTVCARPSVENADGVFTVKWDGTGWKPGSTVTLTVEVQGETTNSVTVSKDGSFGPTTLTVQCVSGVTPTYKVEGATVDNSDTTLDLPPSQPCT